VLLAAPGVEIGVFAAWVEGPDVEFRVGRRKEKITRLRSFVGRPCEREGRPRLGRAGLYEWAGRRDARPRRLSFEGGRRSERSERAYALERRQCSWRRRPSAFAAPRRVLEALLRYAMSEASRAREAAMRTRSAAAGARREEIGRRRAALPRSKEAIVEICAALIEICEAPGRVSEALRSRSAASREVPGPPRRRRGARTAGSAAPYDRTACLAKGSGAPSGVRDAQTRRRRYPR
jgi:hypothetical protein